jgi:hypothetical protein
MMKGTCAILDGEIITSPRSPPDSTVVYQLGFPELRENKYEVVMLPKMVGEHSLRRWVGGLANGQDDMIVQV